jgi:ferritin-like metal-binding protein YciE
LHPRAGGSGILAIRRLRWNFIKRSNSREIRGAAAGAFPAMGPGQPQTNMAKLKTLQDLLVHNLKDLYSAESQLVKALPKMAKAASEPALIEAFKTHLEETKGHVERLKQVGELLGVTPRGVTCKAMKGLVEEGEETIEEEAEPAIKDLALITAAQKVEHYEISGYGSAIALATALGNKDVVALFEATIGEEGKTDKSLTELAAQIIGNAPVAA